VAVAEIAVGIPLRELLFHHAIRTDDDDLVTGGNEQSAVFAYVQSVQQNHGILNPGGNLLHGLPFCKLHQMRLITLIRVDQIKRPIRAVSGIR